MDKLKNEPFYARTILEKIFEEYGNVTETDVLIIIHVTIVISIVSFFCFLIPEQWALHDPVQRVRIDVLDEVLDPIGLLCFF